MEAHRLIHHQSSSNWSCHPAAEEVIVKKLNAIGVKRRYREEEKSVAKKSQPIGKAAWRDVYFERGSLCHAWRKGESDATLKIEGCPNQFVLLMEQVTAKSRCSFETTELLREESVSHMAQP